jgi:TolB-like protein
MKCLGFILFLYLHFNILSSQSVEPPQVGVLDFEPRGIPTSLSQRFTEDFRNELKKANLAQVIDRGTLLSTLEDRGFERSNCNTDYCEALIGRLLDVQFIISGSIVYSDSVYTIDMNMVSVNTGSIEKSKTMVGGSNQNLKDVSETLAWNAFDLKSPQQIAAIEERERIARIASREEVVPVEIKAQFKWPSALRSTLVPGWGQCRWPFKLSFDFYWNNFFTRGYSCYSLSFFNSSDLLR